MSTPEPSPQSPAVELAGLRRDYLVRTPVAGSRRRRRQLVRAVDDVTLRIDLGETVGFVGANGA
ncbi:MAG: methionine ABC transporter ATP-binding protein, partial [Brachybacterium sp.]